MDSLVDFILVLKGTDTKLASTCLIGAHSLKMRLVEKHPPRIYPFKMRLTEEWSFRKCLAEKYLPKVRLTEEQPSKAHLSRRDPLRAHPVERRLSKHNYLEHAEIIQRKISTKHRN